jgi:hypothetical protein
VIVDYILYFQTKSGQATSRKVYKLKQFFLPKNTSITLNKRHPLSATMTTRKLYLGQHFLEIQINGVVLGKTPFQLE